ncbi:uncharacterized protein LOC121370472 [Gigantopelta aegis]|uniref:uncharacterized protein LOC121370472 n=1 Tax=Gigantopelta aegis TaxID=1735272 RepID=UPI001B88DE08|nr:uncharacterized protein LOC121370472 [Gigantopelta aegis]
MNIADLLMLVVTFAMIQHSNAWFVSRRDWDNFKDAATKAAGAVAGAKGAAALIALGKRDISEYDTNKDGVLDLDELEKVMSTRDAEDFLQFADDNGDSEVTVDEFRRIVTELSELE